MVGNENQPGHTLPSFLAGCNELPEMDKFAISGEIYIPMVPHKNHAYCKAKHMGILLSNCLT